MITTGSVEVRRCSIKPQKGAAMRTVEEIEVRRGIGIGGDAGAVVGSPRHVLLADAEVYEQLKLPPDGLRENLLVTNLETLNIRPGQILRSTDGTLLRLTMWCEPCVKLNEVQPGLAKVIGKRRGILARVLSSGKIRCGDQLVPCEHRLSSLPDTPSARIESVLRQIPEGSVTSFCHVTVMAGVIRSYVRVIPRILAKAPLNAPVHRIVAAEGHLIPQHVPDQKRRLQREGVLVHDERVSHEYIWYGDPFVREERETLSAQPRGDGESSGNLAGSPN